MHKSNKTIIVSSWAPPSIGGPQNLYNLLRDIDPNSYCILTSFYNINNLSARVGSWLKCEYVFYDSTSTAKNIAGVENKSKSKKRTLVVKIKHLAKRSYIVRELGGIVAIFTQIIAIVSKGRRAIKNKNINSIIGISDYGPAMIGSYILHKITKKQYSIFLLDLYKGNYSTFLGNILANIFEPLMFKSARNIIVTNEGTLDFYIKRYGPDISKKITIIHNSVFKESYLKLEKPYEPKQPYTIIFTGNIYWPQMESIKNLIKAISEINDMEIKLEIYSPSLKDYLKEIGIVESEKVKIGVARPEDMPKIQNKADILFLPLSWHTKSQAIVDTATPGKLTDYLIAGRPMLIHAPASTFLVKYARENNFAMVVEKEDIEELQRAIRKLIVDKEFSKTIVQNAKNTFMKNHDASKNAIIFKKVLGL